MSEFRVATLQISTGTDVDANLTAVDDALASLDGPASLAVFPEATMCRFGVPLGPVAQPLDGPWASGLRDIARSRGIAVVAGMFTPAADDDRVRNTLVLADRDGNLTPYHKIHLYDAFGFRESDTVAHGTTEVTATVDGVTIGLATCYDIRFPEQFVSLARSGAQVIVVPASWGNGPGKLDQWRLLARARALDSSTFVVAVGQALPDDPAVASAGPTGIGHSLVAGPTGDSLYEAPDGPAHAIHSLDLRRADQAREQVGVVDNSARNQRLQP